MGRFVAWFVNQLNFFFFLGRQGDSPAKSRAEERETTRQKDWCHRRQNRRGPKPQKTCLSWSASRGPRTGSFLHLGRHPRRGWYLYVWGKVSRNEIVTGKRNWQSYFLNHIDRSERIKRGRATGKNNVLWQCKKYDVRVESLHGHHY